MFGRKQKKLIITLLRFGERRGLDLVNMSGGFLHRGTVYDRLSELIDDNFVRVNRTKASKFSKEFVEVRFYTLTHKGRLAYDVQTFVLPQDASIEKGE